MLACGRGDEPAHEGAAGVQGLEGEWFTAGRFQLWGLPEEDATRPDRNWVDGVVLLYADPETAGDPGGRIGDLPGFVGELWVAPSREEELSVFKFLARFRARLCGGGDALGAEFQLDGYELGSPDYLELSGQVTRDSRDDNIVRYFVEGDLSLPGDLPAATVARPTVLSLWFECLEERRIVKARPEAGTSETTRAIERARRIRAIRPSTAVRELASLYSVTQDRKLVREIVAGLPFAGGRAEAVALDQLQALRVSPDEILLPFLESMETFEVLYGLDLLLRADFLRPHIRRQNSARVRKVLRGLKAHDDPQIRQLVEIYVDGIPRPR